MKFISFILLAFLSIIVRAKYLADDSNHNPTSWYWCSYCSASSIAQIANAGYRITDLEIVNSSPFRLSAIVVRNTGKYAQTWWWYDNLDVAALKSKLSQHKARIAHLETYVINGKLRFTVVLTPNTGVNAKAWWWYHGATPGFISNKLQQNKARIVDIEPYKVGGVTRYAVVMIRNAGKDARSWWWYTNAPASFVKQKLKDNKARLIDIERQPFGLEEKFTVVMERSSAKWWWYYGKSVAQLKAKAVVNKARLFHVAPYAGKWAGIMISNS